jgi:hypothetical protein
MQRMSRWFVARGVNVPAESKNSVDVPESKSAFEHQLTGELLGELTGESNECKVAHGEIHASRHGFEKVSQFCCATP